MQAFLKDTIEYNKQNDLNHQNSSTSPRNLEIQIGLLANTIVEHNASTLPSDTIKNPKEQVNAIVLMAREESDEPITIESNPREDPEEQLHVRNLDESIYIKETNSSEE